MLGIFCGEAKNAEQSDNGDSAGENFLDFSEAFYQFGEAIFNKLRIRFYKYCDAFYLFFGFR